MEQVYINSLEHNELWLGTGEAVEAEKADTWERPRHSEVCEVKEPLMERGSEEKEREANPRQQ